MLTYAARVLFGAVAVIGHIDNDSVVVGNGLRVVTAARTGVCCERELTAESADFGRDGDIRVIDQVLKLRAHIVGQLRHGLIDTLADSRRNPAADFLGEHLRRRRDAERRLDRVERAVCDVLCSLDERTDCVRDAISDTLDDIAAEVKPVGICDRVPNLVDEIACGLP